MKIKITDTNKVNAAIAEVEGRATARCASAGDVLGLAKYAEVKLAALLAKSHWAGAQAHYRPGRVANSYNYRAAGTFFTITRGSSAWYLTSVSRDDVGSQSYGGGDHYDITLSVAQQLQIVALNPLLSGITAKAKPTAEEQRAAWLATLEGQEATRKAADQQAASDAARKRHLAWLEATYGAPEARTQAASE